jgi:hypothetical protein
MDNEAESKFYVNSELLMEVIGEEEWRRGASVGGAQSNVFNPTLRLINRKVFTFGALIAS